jgi:NAD-dependent DNA ligase
MNTSVISDATFDRWARELAALQLENPEIAQEGVYADEFADFFGSITGFNLPLSDP